MRLPGAWTSPAVAWLGRALPRAAGFGPSELEGGSGDPAHRRAVIAEHRLGPFLFARREALGPGAFDPDELGELAREHQRAVAASLARALFVREAVEAIGDEVVVLKGPTIVERLYGSWAERRMSDLDLWTPGERARAAARRLGELGYRPTATSHGPAHHLPALECKVRGLKVELHTRLTVPALDERTERAMWDRRRQGASGLVGLDPGDQLIHHALHAIADPIDAPLVRNLFEVAWLWTALGRRERGPTLARLDADPRAPDLRRALALAHALFGGAEVPRPPVPGRLELFAVARLGWCGAPEAWADERARALRHLAVRYFAARAAGEPRTTAADAVEAGRLRLEEWRRGPGQGDAPHGPVVRVPLEMIRLGDRAVVHDRASGRVHLVDGWAADALASAEAPAPLAELVLRVAAGGAPMANARAAVRSLVAHGLLLPADG